MIKTLITGIDGYIGSRVALAFAGYPDGYQVYGLSRREQEAHCHQKQKDPRVEPEDDDFEMNGDYASGLPRPLSLPHNDDIQYIHGDFTNKKQMVSVLFDVCPDIIIHCAGLTPHQNHSDDDYARVNFDGSVAFLDAIRDYNQNRMDCHVADTPRNDVVKFINCSTIGVYGVPHNDDGVVKSSDNCAPLSSYAQSKHDFEHYLFDQSDIPYLNLRIANIPGRDAFINYVLGGGEVTFNGDKPYIRDYIHMDDLSDLFIHGAEYLVNDGESATLNAGSGVGHSFPDIVDEIERQTGQSITRHHGPTKTGDVVRIICDISETKTRLGWSPRLTNLDQIIHYAIDNRSL
jgi:nucleoside-diphosphate-sugar epimerase